MDQDDFIEKCLDQYDVRMEEIFYTAKSRAELESFHWDIKSEILDELPQKWRSVSGSGDVPEAMKTKLGKKLNSLFQKLTRHYEKNQRKQQNELASLALSKDALTVYNDEMDKYVKNHPNASPKEIDMHHEMVSFKVINYAKSRAVVALSPEVLATLKQDMENRRKVYFDRAMIVFRANRDPAIGIDLGTTMCCIMVFYRGKCELVQNRSQGNTNTTPSYVAFHEDGTDTFGYVAKEEAYRNPEITIYDAKRMIGRPTTDEKLKSDMKKWPFEVVDDNGNPKIKSWNRLRYPHEISSRLLTRFRLMADEHLNLPRGTIKKAVITVPAYFTEPQRRATYDAATCAGLKVLNILSEPTAAAIAYSWERRDSGVRTALVYDLGGGTFDVAIAKVDAKNVEIICVDGDTHLGGQDFDQLLMDYCIKDFLDKEGIDLAVGQNSSDKTTRDESRRALSRIKLQCEKAKERLTTTEKTNVEIEGIKGSKNMSVEITKQVLENLVRPLILQTLDIMNRALTESFSKGIANKNAIDDVILVGGSTRMPLVAKMVSTFFDGKQLCKHINPDEAVAYGAAIQAAISNKNDSVKQIEVKDVTPMSLGIEAFEGDDEVLKFSIVIPRNSKIPCKFTKPYTTSYDNQTSILFQIFQGEDINTHGNKLLGKFSLRGFSPKPKHEEKADVTMTIDTNGILQVNAVSTTTSGLTNSITITADRMGMDKATMDRVTSECQQITSF